jgi:hypothetical protein
MGMGDIGGRKGRAGRNERLAKWEEWNVKNHIGIFLQFES